MGFIRSIKDFFKKKEADNLETKEKKLMSLRKNILLKEKKNTGYTNAESIDAQIEINQKIDEIEKVQTKLIEKEFNELVKNDKSVNIGDRKSN